MNRDDIIAKLRAIRPLLEAEGVRHIALFGSRARGDFRPDSDADVLLEVDPASRFSIYGLLRVERLATEATGVPANAFMRRSLEPDFQSSIAPEIVEIF
jgi:predicted nucleotidyltransferase